MNVPLVNSDILNSNRSVSPRMNRKTQNFERSPNEPRLGVIKEKEIKQNTSPMYNAQTKPANKDPDTFRVYIRARPLDSKELKGNNVKKRTSIVKKEDNMVFVFDPDINSEWSRRGEKSYVFDDVFDENESTMSIYGKALKPALENVINGYNSTIFAYGMTGAGKTFTMFGDIYNSLGGLTEHPGIITLIVNDLYQAFERERENGYEFNLKFSYIEIYNEQTRDLLSSTTDNLMIVEDPQKGIMIPNLSEIPVAHHDEVIKYILMGNSRRIMASTHANQFSSRSHAILQLIVEKRNRAKDIVETYTQSKLCLVDLAGSERAATSENRGLRQVEGANINRSLLALGNCINVLSDPHKKGAFVPYRDSKLTRMLKDSLGGNTRTIMVACVSPSYMAYEETVNTLKYASRARKIKKKIVKNVKEVEMHVSQYREIIDSLKAEIDILKKQLQEKGPGSMNPDDKGTEEASNKLDELGARLLAILEENFELSQSLEDIRELRKQNEENMKIRMDELEFAKNDPTLQQKINEEIVALKEVMADNEKTETEMENNMRKLLEEKKVIQETILKYSTETQTNQNLQSHYRKLEDTCSILTKEKTDLESKNQAMKKEAVKIAKEKEEKDARIQELERQVEMLKRTVREKDKMLAQNQQLIMMLAQKAGDVDLSNVRNSLNINNFNNFNNNFMDIIPSTARERKIVIPQDNISIEEKQASSDESNDKSANSYRLGNTKTPPREKSKTNKNPSLIDSSKKNKTDKNKGAAKNENTVQVQQTVRNRFKQSFQPVSIQELKNYAEKLRTVNFDNVPTRNKRKKKNPSKTKKDTFLPTPLQNLSNYQNANKNLGAKNEIPIENPYKITATINRENERPNRHKDRTVTSPPADINYKPSNSPNQTSPFTDISSIMPPNEHSVDYSVKDLILENLYSSNKEVNSRFENINRAGQPAFHVNLATLVRNMNKNSRFEIQREQQDVKKMTPNDQEMLNKLKNINENDFKYNEKSGAQPQNHKGEEAKNMKDSPIGSLRMKYWELVSDNNKFKNEMDNMQSQPPQSSGNQLVDGAKSPNKKNDDTSRDKSGQVHEIRTLESVRDLVRQFKIKLYSLSYAVDNNLLDDYYTEEIFRVIKDYNQNKYILQNNDIVVLKKLENAVFNKLSKNKASGDDSRSLSANASRRIAMSNENFAQIYEGNNVSATQPTSMIDIAGDRQGEAGQRDYSQDQKLQKMNTGEEMYFKAALEQKNYVNRSHTKSPRSSHTPDARFSESVEGETRRPNPVVQSLIEKQRQNLKDEIERAKKQNALKQYPNNVVNIYGSKSLNMDEPIFEEPVQ